MDMPSNGWVVMTADILVILCVNALSSHLCLFATTPHCICIIASANCMSIMVNEIYVSAKIKQTVSKNKIVQYFLCFVGNRQAPQNELWYTFICMDIYEHIWDEAISTLNVFWFLLDSIFKNLTFRICKLFIECGPTC